MTEPLQLLTAGDIARLLGVSRQRVHVLRRRDDFPEPLGRVGNYPVWHTREIERWVRKHRDGAGAPRTAPKTRRSRAKS